MALEVLIPQCVLHYPFKVRGGTEHFKMFSAIQVQPTFLIFDIWAIFHCCWTTTLEQPTSPSTWFWTYTTGI